MKYCKNFYQIKSNDTIFDSIKDEIETIGYYNLPLQDTTKIKDYAKTIKQDDIVIIGIGGSTLGTIAIYDFLKSSNSYDKSLHFLESTDPNDIKSILSKIDLNNAHFIIISKSGSTIETISIFKYISSLINIDKNNCTTEFFKPDVNRTCIYQGTCFDFLKNQDETDVDCGGLICEPCDLGKKCLFDFDCKSGFCHPVDNICALPTCNDGFKNQGEDGVDCGGPCPPCERPTLEQPITIARFLLRGCGPFPWAFVLLASVITLLIYIIGKS